MNFIEAFIHWNKVKNIQKQYAFTLDRVRKIASCKSGFYCAGTF